ncbi:hypothetical protein DSECCO2_540630 [anaerobic digester metagenome]
MNSGSGDDKKNIRAFLIFRHIDLFLQADEEFILILFTFSVDRGHNLLETCQ